MSNEADERISQIFNKRVVQQRANPGPPKAKEPKLKKYSLAVREGLKPFHDTDEPQILPDRVNPSVPETIWGRLQNAGALAATHLELILSDPRFDKLMMRDKVKIIDLALSRAYGSVDGAVRKNLNVFVNPEDARGFNALADLSRRAQRHLPEFNPPSKVRQSADEEGGD